MSYTCRMTPYEGEGKYIFVSYAHKDADQVLPIVDWLADRGYRIWYDRGIIPGSEWPEYIGKHLYESSVVITFVSPLYANSSNCRREISFAQKYDKNILTVILQETKLNLGMDLQLCAQRNIIRTNYPSEEEFLKDICSASGMEECKGPTGPRPPMPLPPSPHPWWKKLLLVISALAIIAAILIGLFAAGIFPRQSASPVSPSPAQTSGYSTEVMKAVDTASVYATARVDNSGSAVLMALDYCRDYLDGDIDEKTLSAHCEQLKEAVETNESSLISDTTIALAENVPFCKAALKTAKDSSVFKDYITFACAISHNSNVSNRDKILDALEEIVQQNYLIVLNESYGAILPIINDPDTSYNSDMVNYVEKYNNPSELTGLINDSLFGQTYVLEDSDNAANTINNRINRSLSNIKYSKELIDKNAGMLWAEIDK